MNKNLIKSSKILGGENDCHTGLSNTQCGIPINMRYNVCLDYVKISFIGNFAPGNNLDVRFKAILNALNVNEFEYTQSFGNKSYKKHYIYGANIHFFGECSDSVLSNGLQTSILEMKGEACREFETLCGNKDIRLCWVNLFDSIIDYKDYKVLRIDLPIDDFTGDIKLESILYKIRNRFYTSNMRKCIFDCSNNILQESEELKTRISGNSKKGLTITLGANTSMQLGMYNKAAERKARGYDVFVENWLRYECRFFHERGDECFLMVYKALKDNTLSNLAFSNLKSMLTLKKDNKRKKSDQGKAPDWLPWQKMLECYSYVKFTSQQRIESDITKCPTWVIVNSSKMEVKALALCENEEEEHSFELYRRYYGAIRLSYADMAKINYARMEANLPFITLEDYQLRFIKNFNDYSGYKYVKLWKRMKCYDEVQKLYSKVIPVLEFKKKLIISKNAERVKNGLMPMNLNEYLKFVENIVVEYNEVNGTFKIRYKDED